MPELHGGPPGDLYIITQVEPHPFFDRRGDDLYTVVPITVPEASLGAKVEVPTIDGRAQVRIPPGTNSGKRLRLREKGAPSVRHAGKRGDQIVEVQIVVPKPEDERVRNLLKELGKLDPEDPRTRDFREGRGVSAAERRNFEKGADDRTAQKKSQSRLHDQRGRRAVSACTRRRCDSTSASDC